MGKLTGRSIIGFREGAGAGEPLHATDPSNGQHLAPGFSPASSEEMELAVRFAADAFTVYSRTPGEVRRFLRKIAEKIESVADEWSNAPDWKRHCSKRVYKGKLRAPADSFGCLPGRRRRLAGSGRVLIAPIPTASRTPRPDIRSMLRPLGPVVVFGASNFPLAFSVAGGDTASALAAGNTVIVKAHAAHPGTSELVGQMVQESVRECGLPEGVFSLLFGSGAQIGTALVKHPLVRAGGFTGSRAAGRILMDVAASRPEPIPFYAEMSSTNPVFILPGALRERGAKHCGRTAQVVHPGSRPVLHQAWNGLPTARQRCSLLHGNLATTGRRFDAVPFADLRHSLVVSFCDHRSQDRCYRQARRRGSAISDGCGVYRELRAL